MLATYRRSLVAVLRAQGTDKGFHQGAGSVAKLVASSPIVQVRPVLPMSCQLWLDSWIISQLPTLWS